MIDNLINFTKESIGINLVINNDIVMFSAPVRIVHFLQLLHVAFFKSLSVPFKRRCDAWMREHPLSPVIKY